MKKSTYNVFVCWKDYYCGVNLLTGHKIVLLKADYDHFLNAPQQLNKTLYSNMIEGGFLIEEEVDEYAKLLHKHNDSVFYNNNTYQLTILPTLECNFRCWYCYEQHLSSEMTSHTYEKITKYIDFIIAQYPIFNFHLDWFGGEPLLYFDNVVKPISEYVKSACQKNNISFRNTMTTNGFLIDDKIVSEFEDIKLSGFQITLDGYKDLHNKTRFEKRGDDSYSKIILNINKICSTVNDASVNIRINYTNKNIRNIGLIADDIWAENRDKTYITLQRVWQTRKIEDDKNIEEQLNEQIESLRSKGIKVNYNRTVYCQGVRCYADTVRQSVVNFDGTLYKCTARNFADWKASVGYLSDEGEPQWNAEYYKHFLKPAFDNPKCRVCQYVPVCLGTCSQKYVEGGELAVMNECDPKEWEVSLNEELLQNLYDYITTAQQS